MRQSLNCRSEHRRIYCQFEHVKQVAQKARREKLRPDVASIPELLIRVYTLYAVNLDTSSRWPRTRVQKICAPTLHQSLNSRCEYIHYLLSIWHVKQVAQKARRKKLRLDVASISEFPIRVCTLCTVNLNISSRWPRTRVQKICAPTLHQFLNSRCEYMHYLLSI